MVTTVPSVTYDGVNPDPVEWANDFVKPAIEELQATIPGDVQFEVARTGAQTAIGSGSFSTYPLDGTPTVNLGGGSWNSGTYIYTIPKTGLYLCLAAIRLNDGGASRSVAVAIGTSNADGPHVLWQQMGGVTRSGVQYTRMTRFTVGDLVRLYIYSDGANFDTKDNAGVGVGQFMSLMKVAS
jgi:hypothetical protein